MIPRRCLGCTRVIPSDSYCARCKLGTGWGKGRNRTMQAQFRVAVLARDGYRCTWHAGQERCTRQYGLRAAHIRPLGEGGDYSLSNGRTLCAEHDRMTDKRAR